MTSPCHRCPAHRADCHSTCPRYRAWKAERDKQISRRDAARALETAVSEVREASRNKTTRRNSVYDRLRRKT